MARAHFVKKARKDNPVVKRGESYYWWKFKRGPKMFSTKPPRPSQLTQSDKISRVLAAGESVGDAVSSARDDMGGEDATSNLDAVISALEEAASEMGEVAEEYRESAESIREHFSESETADQCDEKADHLEEVQGEIESAQSTVEEAKGEAERHLEALAPLRKRLEGLDSEKDKGEHNEVQSEIESLESDMENVVDNALSEAEEVEFSVE